MFYLSCVLHLVQRLIGTALLVSFATFTQNSAAQVNIDSDDIGGVVNGVNGHESGVWVIAETTDTPTLMRKIVVTDDEGRFLVPDLPDGQYKLWVRGYGLLDSEPVAVMPGNIIQLNVESAPDAVAAAEVYPASYWFSLLQLPNPSLFPMGVSNGESVVRGMQNQYEVVNAIKAGCQICHQLGNKATRELSPELRQQFDSSEEAWARRLISGQVNMLGRINGMGSAGLSMFADWSDRIADGAVPEMPARPSGLEQNIVITTWDVSGPQAFMHDLVASYKDDPTLNSNGPVYAIDYGYDQLHILNPITNSLESLPLPIREGNSIEEMRIFANPNMLAPSPAWGEEPVHQTYSWPNVPRMDERGRVWMTVAMRKPENPEYCFNPELNRFAEYWPIESSGRQAAFFDPETREFTTVDTCYRTHHLELSQDANTMYFTPGTAFGMIVGWVDIDVLESTGDEALAQGWCAAYEDVDQNGLIDPDIDSVISGSAYGLAINPVDDSVWAAYAGTPGRILRMVRGNNPPETCLFELYEPPFQNPELPGVMSFSPRGIDVDTNGIVWTALSGSGEMASFDRSKCEVLNGPTATGQHCPEGWTMYPIPGPNFIGTDIKADFQYYNWVDRHNTFGLGENVPVSTGTDSDSLLVFDPTTEEFLTLRVPYPLGFYSRGLDGRIDDPEAGWKGRGLWAPNATRVQWHTEGGKVPSYLVKFQIRPDPLAK